METALMIHLDEDNDRDVKRARREQPFAIDLTTDSDDDDESSTPGELVAARERVAELEHELGAAKRRVLELEMRKVQVFVKTLTGRTITLYINESTTTVLEFKTLVQGKIGLLVCQQRAIFSGRELEDHRTLASYGIKKEATIHLVLRLGGC